MISELISLLPFDNNKTKKCFNYPDFLKARDNAFEVSYFYSPSWEAGFTDAYCGFICPFRSQNFIPVSELKNRQTESRDRLFSVETSALIFEISLNKYYQSERAKKDIGWENSAQDFMEHYFPLWARGFLDCLKANLTDK